MQQTWIECRHQQVIDPIAGAIRELEAEAAVAEQRDGEQSDVVQNALRK